MNKNIIQTKLSSSKSSQKYFSKSSQKSFSKYSQRYPNTYLSKQHKSHKKYTNNMNIQSWISIKSMFFM